MQLLLRRKEFTNNLKGVIVSGNTDYGKAYCGAGNVISEQYNVPVLYKFEDARTDEDIEKIKEIIKQ